MEEKLITPAGNMPAVDVVIAGAVAWADRNLVISGGNMGTVVDVEGSLEGVVETLKDEMGMGFTAATNWLEVWVVALWRASS